MKILARRKPPIARCVIFYASIIAICVSELQKAGPTKKFSNGVLKKDASRTKATCSFGIVSFPSSVGVIG